MANRGDGVVQPDVARECVHSGGVSRDSKCGRWTLLVCCQSQRQLTFHTKKATVSGVSWTSIAKTHDVLL